MTENESLVYLYWGLLSHGEPRIVADAGDFEIFSKEYKNGAKVSVQRTLEKRARKAVKFWIQKLGEKPRPRGRPKDQELRRLWKLASIAEERGFPRKSLIGLLGNLDPEAAKDRLRKGIKAVKRQGKNTKA